MIAGLRVCGGIGAASYERHSDELVPKNTVLPKDETHRKALRMEDVMGRLSQVRRVSFIGLLGLPLAMSSLTPGSAGMSEESAMSRDQFDELFDKSSNWGRWGPDDELGTLNLIGAGQRRAAASLVREGLTVSLAMDLNKKADAWNNHPLEHVVNLAEISGVQVAGDVYSLDVHGLSHTHLDALPHFAHNGYFYNGIPYETAKSTGVEMLGVQNIGRKGIVGRGVLIDMPRFLGVEYLKPGYAITTEDIIAWERHRGVTIGSGDILLVRTGRWVSLSRDGHWNFLERAAGLHASVAAWLRQRDVAVLGSDGISDALPSRVDGRILPLHELALAGLGMPLLDNLDLDLLAEEAERLDRTTFLFVASPMRIPGGTAAPINPLAIF